MFESHHVSRHFEKRCQQSHKKKGQGRNSPQVNRRRARLAKRLPKLSLGVHAATHLILAAKATTGLGSDHPHFLPLLSQAATRMHLDLGLADAGYDSEANHRSAREGLGIRTLIPATIGRPGKNPLKGRYRGLMRQQFKRRRYKKQYGQRWQVETVNSMMKRNLGSACRARTAHGRKKDLMLRAVTHNLMIVANL